MSPHRRPFLSNYFPIFPNLSSSKLLALSTLLCALLGSANASSSPPTLDPFADPKNDPHNPLKYIANNTLTAIATTTVLLIAVAQSCAMYKWGGKWMASMTAGAYFFAVGLGFRFPLHSNPDDKMIYIAQYLLVVLSPCFFIAGVYVVLGRLANRLNADKYLLVPSKRLTLYFVCSDILTFLTQVLGGILISSSDTPKDAKLGTDLFLGGLIAQLVSFVAFCGLLAVFLYRIRTSEQRTWVMEDHKPWFNQWKALAGAMIVSCIGILIRSGYRVAELSEGLHGHLATTEGYFYMLDTLPLCIAIGVFVPFWPGRFITETPAKVEQVSLGRVGRWARYGRLGRVESQTAMLPEHRAA